jgi:hypothetical protein
MKKSILLSCMIAAAFSVTAQSIQLKKGQVIKSVASNNSDVEMMMGGSKSDVIMNSKMLVIEETSEGYVITRSIESMKLNADAMGQNMQFDSEKADDRKSEVGEMMSKQLNHIDTFSLDRRTGLVKSLNKNKPEIGGMAMMSTGGEEEVQGAGEAFLVVPNGVKAGSTWSDSISIKGLKTVRTFKVTAVNSNTVDLETTGIVKGTTESEVQGMTMNMNINSTARGTMKVDMKSGLVLSYNNVANVNMDMDMMGQNMQVTTKATTSTTNSFQ